MDDDFWSVSIPSLLALTGVWLLFTIAFVIVLCRNRRNQDFPSNLSRNHARQIGTSSPTRLETPKRLIQIYYIGNGDSAAAISNPASFLDKILRKVDDEPPRYEEVASSSPQLNAESSQPEIGGGTNVVRNQTTDQLNGIAGNDVVIVVERNAN